MAEAIESGTAAEAIRRYRAYRADPRHRYAETEEQLNNLGYRLLEQKRFLYLKKNSISTTFVID